ncbi:transporter substrate-binding domain-containing protein [Desulfovibrio aminophilus]|uniref:substrate-binding periplasmic protein n=1 Tax=Desulfovibrio aminophilus TaxID=81425 RepID=UPI003397C026
MIRRLLVLLPLLLVVALPARAGGVRLATLDWEPYIGRNLPGNGYVAEVVREAFRRQGYTVTFEFMPWARAVAMARTGEIDGYLPEYAGQNFDGDFFLSASFPGGPLGFFKLRSRDIFWSTLDDLKPYRIGVVRGRVNTAAFDARPDMIKEAVTGDLQNLRKLAIGRVDLVLADRNVGLFLAQKYMGADAERIEFMLPVLEEKALHIRFPIVKPDSLTLVRAFDAGLASMSADGSLGMLQARYGF